MRTARDIFRKMQELTSEMVGIPVCIDQNYPVMKTLHENRCRVEIEAPNATVALKAVPYAQMYEELNKRRSFNIKMVDGALISMQYEFQNDGLVSHRLCYFPSPDLSDFQEMADEYEADDIYVDIVDPRIVTVPIRFDYDNREGVVKELEHPASHLTLGQYKNCRIPVSRPIMPHHFIHFIIRNFYHTTYRDFCSKLSFPTEMFECTITDKEKSVLHIAQE